MYFYTEEPEPECYECSQKDNLLDDVKYWLRAVLNQLYGVEDFEQESLDHQVQELCAYVGMEPPQMSLAIQKKSQENASIIEMEEILKDWEKLNNTYLKSLHKAV